MNRDIFPLYYTMTEEFNNQLRQLNRFTNHGPSLGRFVETLLINLLKKYLPNSIDFSSGFIKPLDPNSSEEISPQLDIICYDRLNYPIFFDIGEIKVITPKAVKAIIEIKSTLNKSSLEKALDLTTSLSLSEVPLESKVYLFALKSNIKKETVFRIVKNFYSDAFDKRRPISKLLGGITCLDWNESIVFGIRDEGENIEYSMHRIRTGINGVPNFILSLVYNIYGSEPYRSIANVLAPSISEILESYVIKLGYNKP